MGNAFHAYKMNSSINRTMLNCNFKQKEQTIAQLKIQKIIEEERLHLLEKQRKKKQKLLKGEKNFWRRKNLKARNQSVSIAAMDDLSDDEQPSKILPITNFAVTPDLT